MNPSMVGGGLHQENLLHKVLLLPQGDLQSPDYAHNVINHASVLVLEVFGASLRSADNFEVRLIASLELHGFPI